MDERSAEKLLHTEANDTLMGQIIEEEDVLNTPLSREAYG